MSENQPAHDKEAEAERRMREVYEEEKKLDDKRKRSEFRAQWISKLVPLVLAIGTAGAGAAGFFVNPSTTDNSSAQAQLLNKIDALKQDLTNSQAELKKTQDQINALLQNPSQVNDLQLKAISLNVTDTQTKVSGLEKVIMDNPAKALEMPLLRKDLDSLKESSRSDLLATKQEIERIYDMNKWFLGLMVTSSVAIIGLAISNFFKKQ